MPQGKIKTKVQVLKLLKKKSNPKKKNKPIRKGSMLYFLQFGYSYV